MFISYSKETGFPFCNSSKKKVHYIILTCRDFPMFTLRVAGQILISTTFCPSYSLSAKPSKDNNIV